MKKNFTLTFAMLLCLFYIGGNAQTQFWSDTFEDAGAPSSGVRTPSVAEFICPSTNTYYKRVDLASISLQNGTYSNIQGTKFGQQKISTKALAVRLMVLYLPIRMLPGV